MKKRMRTAAFVMALAMSLTMMPGGQVFVKAESDTNHVTTLATKKKSKIRINKSKASLVVGKTLKLKISGTSKKVKWTSGKKSVATVNSKGTVTAKKRGTAVITARVNGKKYTCKVTVKNTDSLVEVTKTEVTVKKGQSVKIPVYLYQDNVIIYQNTNNSLICSAAWGPKWVNHENYLLITGKRVGTTTIDITNGKNEEEYEVKVTVTE